MEAEPPQADLPKRKRRWFQFSLRTLLTVVTIIAVLCGWFGHKLQQARAQQVAVEKLGSLGVQVFYDYQPLGPNGWQATGGGTTAQPPGPQWLRDLVGIDFVSNVSEVVVISDVFMVGENWSMTGTLDTKFQVANRPDLWRPLTRMKRLYLYSSKITDSALTQLPDLPELEKLCIEFCSVSELGFRTLERFKALKSVTIGGYWTDEGSTDVGIAALTELPALEELDISGHKISDAGLKQIAKCDRLKVLRLNGELISDAGLRCLAAISTLQELSLANTAVSDEGIKLLDRFPHLRSLSLDGTKITDRGLATLSNLAQIESLSIANTAITVEGVRHLARMPHLTSLDVSGAKIDAAGLGVFRQLASLKTLTWNEIDFDDRKSLQRALPNLEIVVGRCYVP